MHEHGTNEQCSKLREDRPQHSSILEDPSLHPLRVPPRSLEKRKVRSTHSPHAIDLPVYPTTQESFHSYKKLLPLALSSLRLPHRASKPWKLIFSRRP